MPSSKCLRKLPGLKRLVVALDFLGYIVAGLEEEATDISKVVR